MKKLLHKVRQKSPEFRLAVALGLSLCMTGIIAALWIVSFSSDGGLVKQKNNAPSPLDALVGSVKNVVDQPKSNQNPNNIQIIDANAPDPSPQIYDETNPYQTSQ